MSGTTKIFVAMQEGFKSQSENKTNHILAKT